MTVSGQNNKLLGHRANEQLITAEEREEELDATFVRSLNQRDGIK